MSETTPKKTKVTQKKTPVKSIETEMTNDQIITPNQPNQKEPLTEKKHQSNLDKAGLNAEQTLKQLLEDPKIDEVAVALVDLIEMQKGQMHSNIMTAAMINSILDIMLENNITTLDKFQGYLDTNVKAIEQQYSEGLEEFLKETEEKQ